MSLEKTENSLRKPAFIFQGIGEKDNIFIFFRKASVQRKFSTYINVLKTLLTIHINDLQDADILFFEQEASFDWHPGMLIEEMDLQTPFIADLVTFADPTNRFSYLNYLHKHNRMYPFFFFNRFNIPREEYNAYCKWVASELNNCQFGQRVTDVTDVPDKSCYTVAVQSIADGGEKIHYAKHIILGTGSIPNIPEALQGFPEEDITHTSRYTYFQDALKQGSSIMSLARAKRHRGVL